MRYDDRKDRAQLKRAMDKKKPWKRVVDNKMRGDYGVTDFGTRTIKINKALSKRKPMYKRPVNKGATKYPDILGTIAHEEYHRKHPKAAERTVRKKERELVKGMSKKEKSRLYSKFK